MQVIRGLHNLRQEHRGCVATIGSFDGGSVVRVPLRRRADAADGSTVAASPAGF